MARQLEEQQVPHRAFGPTRNDIPILKFSYRPYVTYVAAEAPAYP